MVSRKSQTVVALNAKLSNVDLQTIPYNGATYFAEGMPVKFGAGGMAVAPDGGSTSYEPIYINFVDSNRTDVIDVQGDPFNKDLPALKLGGSGHLTGIRGSGIDIGLPASSWHSGALPTVGQGVFVNSTSKKFDAKDVALAAVGTSQDLFYGIVERIANQRAYFCFTTRPIMAASRDTTA